MFPYFSNDCSLTTVIRYEHHAWGLGSNANISGDLHSNHQYSKGYNIPGIYSINSFETWEMPSSSVGPLSCFAAAMSSPANTTNASDADEATSNNNETTEPLGVTFAGVQAVLTEHSLPLNIGRDDLRDLMLLTLADLRDNILLEYGTQHTRVAPAALARSFEDYVRDLLRLIDEALTALGLIVLFLLLHYLILSNVFHISPLFIRKHDMMHANYLVSSQQHPEQRRRFQPRYEDKEAAWIFQADFEDGNTRSNFWRKD